jgi:threonine dehydratase
MITPNEEYAKLATELKVPRLFFKREDLHPYKSHKGRSIPVMMDHYIAKGISQFAISSSGNAALAAALYAKEKKVELDIYVGRKIANSKLYKLQDICDGNVRLHQVDRPLQSAQEKSKDPQIISLRQSTDDTALEGYKELANELREIPNLGAVFIGTSSGTTAQALALALTDVNVCIVQTTSCHPLAESVGAMSDSQEDSIADAIVDKIALRKERIKALISDAYIVSNENIKAAQTLTKEHTGLTISTNSALSVAGLMEAIYTGSDFDKTVVCVIAGD